MAANLSGHQERSSDLGDQASRLAQINLEIALAGVISQKIDMSNPSKQCWQCEEPTASDQHRWCSAECRDDWEAANA